MKTKFLKQELLLLSLIFSFAFLVSACTNLPFARQNLDQSDDMAPVPAGQVAMIENSIIMTKPLTDEVIESPAAISGKVLIPAERVYFRLFDAWNNLVASSSAEIVKDSSTYSATIEFPVVFTEKGFLQAFTLTEDKTAENNLIKVPVLFKSYKKPLAKLFFSNIKNDPELKECGKVYPVDREIIINKDLVNNVLQGLFKGLTESEMKDGYVSNFPESEIKINKMEYKDGLVIIDFTSSIIEKVTTQCRVEAMVAQITETLKQFSDVKQVEILVDGKDIKSLKVK